MATLLFATCAAILLAPIVIALIHEHTKRITTTTGGSALISYATTHSALTSLHEGQLQHMYYGISSVRGTNYVLIRIELPFVTKAHLLNLPVAMARKISPKSLEAVMLEGDYHNFFQLYAEHGQQVTARYLLDPKAMAHVIDYCRHHAWELIGSELYLLSEGKAGSTMPTGVAAFINEIRPVVARPLSEAELAAITPYGQDRRPSLPCPLCGEAMPNQHTHFVCTKHGVLLLGRQLAKLKRGELHITHEDRTVPDSRRHLKCPSCGSPMEEIRYSGGPHIIDGCANCPYRWLDGIEIHAILPH